MISAKVFGKGKAKISARKLMTKIDRVANQSAKEGAEMIRNESIRLVKNQKGSGTQHSGLPNPSSSRGQDAPVSQSGELAKSIRKNRVRPKKWRAWSNVVQAWWSVGLPDSPNFSSRRPFFQTAASNKLKDIITNAEEALRKLLK